MTQVGAPPRRARAGRRRAGGVAHSASTCRRSTPTSTSSRATRCSRPTGIGVVYGKQELLEDMPPWQGGGNMIARRDVRASTFYRRPPTRFEAGTGNIADAVGLGAALDYLERIGMREHRAPRARAARATPRGARADPGLRLIGTAPEKAGVLSFVARRLQHRGDGRVARSGRHRRARGPPLRAAEPGALRPSSTVRPSLAFYNTHDEVDFLAGVVRRALQR